MNVILLLMSGFFGFGAPEEPSTTCLKNCQLSDNGVEFIRKFEGYYPYVYKDSAGLPTIGIGHLIKPGEKFATPMMAEAAKKLFLQDVAHAVKFVNAHAAVSLNNNQADALFSFTYNVGGGGFAQSSVLKYTNLKNYARAADSFILWNKINVNGVMVPVRGLTRRREAEAELYRGE